MAHRTFAPLDLATGPSTLTLTPVTLVPGTPRQAPLVLNANTAAIALSIDRTVAGGMNSLTSSSGYEFDFDETYDGTTFHPIGGFTNVGGIIMITPKGGGTATQLNNDVLSTTLQDTVQQTRTLRLTVTASGPSNIVIQGTLTVS